MGVVLALLAGLQVIARSNSPAPPVQIVSIPAPVPQALVPVAPPSPAPMPPGPTIAAPAQPRAPLQSYVTPFDRPLSVAREQPGKVTVRLAVGQYGRVTGCQVARSSGSDALDAATCQTLVRRARFTPARDSNGNAVADVAVQEIEWLPEPAQPAEPGVAGEQAPR